VVAIRATRLSGGDASVPHQHEHGRCGELFGDRCELEDVAHGHRHVILQIRRAIPPREQGVSAVNGDDDHPSQHLPPDRLAGDRVNDCGHPFSAAHLLPRAVLRLSGEGYGE
jgi:hypothetical protein